MKTRFDPNDIEHLHEREAAIHARLNGKPVQFMGIGSGEWMDAGSDSVPWGFDHRYRPAPEPVSRPWSKPADVPIGSIVRHEKTGGRWMIAGANPDARIYIANGASYEPSEMLSNFTMDDGSPCGVSE